MCYARPMLSLDDLFIAALTSAKSWQQQEAMLQGFGFDAVEIEAVRVALEQADAEAVARIVAGPEPD